MGFAADAVDGEYDAAKSNKGGNKSNNNKNNNNNNNNKKSSDNNNNRNKTITITRKAQIARTRTTRTTKIRIITTRSNLQRMRLMENMMQQRATKEATTTTI